MVRNLPPVFGRLTTTALLAVLTAISAFAQNIKASVSGTVTDPQSSVVTNAMVTVRDLGRKREWTMETSDAGLFRQSALDPGMYEVAVKAKGFSTYRTKAFALSAGESSTLVIALAIGEMTSEVVVMATPVVLQHDDAKRGRTFDEIELGELPNAGNGFAGRNFYVQALTTPGVAYSDLAHRPFAVNGQRPRNNNYMVDSVQINDPNSGFIAGRGRTEQVISQEAVAGMELLTHNFKAEYGRNSGAIVSLVSKNGSNDFHGSAYLYHSNSSFGARDFFAAEKAKSHNNLAGFTLGGPVKRNKAFFFGNLEINKERGDDVAVFRTLTPDERARANPIVQPLVNLYPESTTGSRIFSKGVPAPANQHTYLFRLDYALTDRQTLMVRNNFTDNKSNLQNLAGFVGHHLKTKRQTQSATVHHTSIPTADSVNELRASYMRFGQFDDLIEPLTIGNPAVNGEIGLMIVPGLSPGGTISFMGVQLAVNVYSLSNDFSLSQEAHTLKFGSSLRQVRSDGGRLNNSFAGKIFFPSIGAFLAAQPLSYTRLIGNPFIGLRRWEWDAYIQDDWHIQPNLTLNIGLRYELYTSPTEMHNRIPNEIRFPTDRNNFAPRIGLAWKATGKIVLRSAYGLFYNAPEMDFVGLTRFNPPNVYTLSAFRPQMPDLLSRAKQSIPSGLVIPEPHSRTGYAQHFNMTLESELGSPRSTISVGYVGTVGTKLSRTRLPNGGEDLAQELRADPSVGLVSRLETSGVSNYHSFQLGLTQRLSTLFLRASYTYGRFIDDVSDLSTGNTQPARGIIPIDETNLELDRAVSDFNRPHVLTFSYLWDIPWIEDNHWLGGWKFSGITTLQSGNPFTLYSGTDNGNGSDNNRIHAIQGSLIRNPSAAQAIEVVGGLSTALALEPTPGTIGTLGRNTERGDPFLGWNIGLHKNFNLGKKIKSQLRFEVFNLFNTTNFNPTAIDNVLSIERDQQTDYPVRFNQNFGCYTETFGPRSAQIALRFTF